MKTKNIESECSALFGCPGVYELVSGKECGIGSCSGVYQISPNEDCSAVFGCPGVYQLNREECGVGACPGVYRSTSEGKCGPIGGCPSVFDGIEKDYLIIGSLIENPSQFGLEKKVGKGEVLIKIPKSIIDNMRK